MQRILIAEASEEYRAPLSDTLQSEYQVVACQDGATASKLLTSQRFDGLLLDLMLPELDGLSLLQSCAGQLPKNILAVTSFCSPYVQQTLKDLGVDYMLLKPCPVHTIVTRMRDMLRHADAAEAIREPQAYIAGYLQNLGFSTKRDGYHQLRIGIPLFAQDCHQSLSKELYPSIAASCGQDNQKQVERSIRSAIGAAWKERDEIVWAAYFPRHTGKCPSNKAFISRLAQLLLSESF
ncbi:MAG TPA: response regulator [Candidatus Faecousia intestinigallinarum]|nr:response regulator [Candidatus Faecousia intestinigallinarum]